MNEIILWNFDCNKNILSEKNIFNEKQILINIINIFINIIGSLSTIDYGIYKSRSLWCCKEIQISLCQIIFKEQHYVK